METSATPLNHFFDSQIIQQDQQQHNLQQQRQQQQQQQIHQHLPTTSNGRQRLQTQSGNIHTATNNNNCRQLQLPVRQALPQSSVASTFELDSSHTSIGSGNLPTTSNGYQILPQLPASLNSAAQQSQNPYQFKCSLLEYHIHEAILINKALRSELQEYRQKIDFEKKLRTVLIDRVKNFSS